MDPVDKTPNDQIEHSSWKAHTDGCWTPPPLLELALLATTNPGSKAGAGIAFFPSADNWKEAPVYCIEIDEGAAIGCQDAYMMEVIQRITEAKHERKG